MTTPRSAFRLAAAALVLATPGLAGCDWLNPQTNAEKQRTAAQERARARALQATCASQATYDRLKLVLFEEAIRIRNADPVNLETLASHATVRVEQPVVRHHDEELDLTVCAGRFVLQIPPGAERAFGGERSLEADVEYAAQASADGNGRVYRVKGAEPIVYKLAAFDLRGQAYRTAGADTDADADDTQVAARDEPPPMPPVPPPPPLPPVIDDNPPPPPLPTARPAPAPPRATARPAPAPAPRETRRAGTSNPSFNCRNARTRSEKMVCGSDALAALDRRMSAQFYEALDDSDSATRAELRRSRDRFLAYRDRCSSEACVAQAYRDRMDEIDDIAGW